MIEITIKGHIHIPENREQSILVIDGDSEIELEAVLSGMDTKYVEITIRPVKEG